MRAILLLLALLLTTSCVHRTVPSTPSAADLAFRELRAQQLANDQAKAELHAKEVQNLKDALAAVQAQMQKAGDSNFLSVMAVTLLSQSRLKDILTNYVAETAAVLPGPTGPKVQESIARLTKERDEALTTAADIQSRHEAALAEVQVLRDVTAKVEAQRQQLDLDAKEYFQRAILSERDKANVLNEAAQKDADAAARKLAVADATNAQNALLAKVCYSAAVLLILGAVAFAWKTHVWQAVVCSAGAILLFCIGYYLPQVPKWAWITIMCVLVIGLPAYAFWTYTRGKWQTPPKVVTKGDYTFTTSKDT